MNARFGKAAAIITAALSIPAAAQYITSYTPPARNIDGVALVEPAPIVPGSVVIVQQQESLGREWQTRTHRHMQVPTRFDWPSPGPDTYGAAEDDFRVISIRVGQTRVAISPWVRVDSDGNNGVRARIERERQRWLRENGYTNSVRTFRNHSPSAAPDQAQRDWRDGDWKKIRIQAPKSRDLLVRAGAPSARVELTPDAPQTSEVLADAR